MSGHSKWSTIKRKKGANDAAKAKVLAKISKEIIIAVREGGSDPNSNSRLRAALARGKSENMPNANIERAIKKALGDSDKVQHEEIIYEGYGPGGVAILVHCLTDNRNRTGPEVRHVFSKNGGNLGELNCVAYLFERKALVLIKGDYDYDQVFEEAVELGADSVEQYDDISEIMISPDKYTEVLKYFEEKSYHIEHTEISMFPESYITLEDKDLEMKVLSLIEQMEELEDVQSVSHNLEIID